MTSEHTTEPWTEEEAMAFTEALTAFRDGLPPRQQDAFAAILRTAAEAARDADVQGYFLFIRRLPYEDEMWKFSGAGIYPVDARTDEAR